MDAVARLAKWQELSPAQWLALANRVLPPAATAALVLAIAYTLARLTWTLVPGPQPDAAPPEIAPAAPAGDRAGGADRDFSALLDSHLFGEAPQAPAEPAVADAPVDAPDTTLSLQLTGIQASEDSAFGQAIIASSRNDEKAYAVGDTIDGTSGVRLHAVYSDRVILNRGGQLETLRLPKEQATSRAGGGSTARVAPPARPAQQSLRQVISDNANKITQVIRLTPHAEGGQMIGFRVAPGKDAEAFKALGLQPGDIVTDVNGVAVNDPAQGLKVYEALGEASVANVTILRDGNPQVIAIDTSQLQNVAEDVQ